LPSKVFNLAETNFQKMKGLYHVIALSLLVIQFSCINNPENTNRKKAIAFNDSAVDLIMTHGHDSSTMVKAITLLDKSISVDSTFFKAYSNKLYFERLQKNFKGALVTALKAQSIAPSDGSLYLTIGMLYEKTGDSITAQRFYNESSSLFSKAMDSLDLNNKKNFELLVQKAVCLIFLRKTTESRLAIQLATANNGGSDHQRMVLDGYSTLSRKDIFDQWLYGNPMQTFSKNAQ
jgi:tetratricopeptide (TPR) repeat protein